MKKLILTLCCICVSMGMMHAENLSEILKSNDVLSGIFVNPLGMDNAVESNNIDSLIASLDKDTEYKTLNLGVYGNVLSITPKDMTIGGVKVAKLMIFVQNDANGMIIQSEPSENYKDMADYIDAAMKDFKTSSDAKESSAADNFKTYMLGENYGISVGSMPDQKMSLAMLLDMKNLKGFLSLANKER